MSSNSSKVILFQAPKSAMRYNILMIPLMHYLIVSKVMQDMGEKINPNYVQIGLNNYFVINNKEMWINIPLGFDLPVEEIVIIFDTEIIGFSTNSPHYYSSIQNERLVTFHSKKAKVTVKVDIYSCFEFSVETFDGVYLNEELPYRDNPMYVLNLV